MVMMVMVVVFWSVMFPLTVGSAGRVEPTVNLPPPVCALKGSSVSLPCSFTPLRTEKGVVSIVRVVWCKNHEVCQGKTPSVYASDKKQEEQPRFVYRGDKKADCTLQIQELRREDEGTYRFRMEAKDVGGHFTNQTGVNVSVVDKTELRINSSSDDGKMAEGQNVSLRCTSSCTFHDLSVTWLRDDHGLSEIGPDLQLGPLTAEDSGSYSCVVNSSRSPLFRLHIETTGWRVEPPLVGGVTLGVLLVLCALILVIFIVKRKPAATNKHQEAAVMEAEPKREGDISTSYLAPAESDVSYAHVHFKHTRKPILKNTPEDTSVIYSLVSTR